MKMRESQILKSCLDLIQGISNKDYQRKVWILGQGPQIDDFDETVCNFFQECEEIIKNHNDYKISEKQFKKLCDFHVAFRAFCDGPGVEYYLPQFFIDTPEWTQITEMAKEVLIAFNYDERKGCLS